MTRGVKPREAAERKARLRAVPCYYCAAQPGEPCKSPDGKAVALHHAARHNAAVRLAVTR